VSLNVEGKKDIESLKNCVPRLDETFLKYVTQGHMSHKGQNVLHRIKCPEKDNYVPQRTIFYPEDQERLCPAKDNFIPRGTKMPSRKQICPTKDKIYME